MKTENLWNLHSDDRRYAMQVVKNRLNYTIELVLFKLFWNVHIAA